MEIKIRKFQEKDIPLKVKWINDEKNNKYLHYDLPLREDKTIKWFKTLENRTERFDCTILCDGIPVGLIGLLNIDIEKKSAEYYVCLGDHNFKGKGVASVATNELLKVANEEFKLEEIYLYTEVDNISAQKLFERIGFKNKKLIKNDLFYQGKNIDRYFYAFNLRNLF